MTPKFRWEKPDPAQSHWLYVDAEDRVVAEVWRDGLTWTHTPLTATMVADGRRPETFTMPKQYYFTAEAAQKAVEQAYV